MLRHRKIYILTVIVFNLYSCNSTKEIFGTYKSNFAVIGFFGTRIDLRSDSTFSYRMKGDLMYDTATGIFRIEGNYIKLTYDLPKPDSSKFFMINGKGEKEYVDLSQIFANRNLRPNQYILAPRKLYTTYDNGKLVKKSQGLSKHKKYLFWGQHFMTTRKYYLAKESLPPTNAIANAGMRAR